MSIYIDIHTICR